MVTKLRAFSWPIAILPLFWLIRKFADSSHKSDEAEDVSCLINAPSVLFTWLLQGDVKVLEGWEGIYFDYDAL